MRHYPMALSIRQRPCLVVGGGEIALGRARLLRQAGGHVIVVSPTFNKGFEDLEGLDCRKRPFEDGDLDGVFLAFAATDDVDVNRKVYEGAAARGILCNVADTPELCDFNVPAVVEQGNLVIAVSTGGASPALSARLRGDIEAWLPEDMETYVQFLNDAREMARQEVPDPELRMDLARHLASQEGFNRFRGSTPEERAAWVNGFLKHQDTIPRSDLNTEQDA